MIYACHNDTNLYVKRFKYTFWALILTIHNEFSQPNLDGGHLGFDKNPMLSCRIEMSVIHNRNLQKIWFRKIIISFGPSSGTGIPLWLMD